jgi:uncharacterized GH25 family protein
MTKIKTGLLCFAVIFMSAQMVFAHHLWVAKKDDVYAVCRGMIAERLDDYDPQRVTQIKAFGKDGHEVTLQRHDKEDGAFFSSDKEISMAVVRTDWGHRVNTTQGKKFMTRQEAEQEGFRIINSFFSTQFGKSLFANSDAITKPVNMMLELVPLNGPFEMPAGEPLRVKLLFEGKPLPDTALFMETGQEIKTDKEGIARVDIDEKGTQLIWARHQVHAVDDQGLDHHVYTTFLNFEVE